MHLIKRRFTIGGDVSLDEWPMGDDQTEEPWTSFVRARRHLADGDQDLAARLWFAIAADESGPWRAPRQGRTSGAASTTPPGFRDDRGAPRRR